MRPRIFLFLLIFLSIAALAQGAKSSSFISYINNSSDGGWFDQAILLNNNCDFSGCQSRMSAEKIFNETIFKQECDYVSSIYGIRGKDWEISGAGAVEVNIFSNQRYYDDLGINLFGRGENIVLHFDVTSSVNLLKDLEYKKF